MTTVKFRMFGPPSLTRDGRVIRLHSSKAMALLAYLVCEAEMPHSRERLSALLWADATQSSGRQNLRQALYSLRRSLGDLSKSCLATDRETVTFHPHPDFFADIQAFSRLATQESPSYQSTDELLKDVALYRGTLLEGIALSDCPVFDEWLFLERERFGQQAIGLMQLAIDQLLAAGAVNDALPLGHRLLALDSLNEGSHQRLMQIYAGLGDGDAVVRQYRVCADILMAELGVEPMAATAALCDELATASSTSTSTSATVAAQPYTRPVSASSFLGCDDELAALSTILREAIAGQDSLVFVHGESGIGKSRTVHEFIRRVVEERAVIWLEGACYEAEYSAPYTMWADVVGTLNTPQWRGQLNGLRDVWWNQLARLAPGLAQAAEPPIDLSAPESQLRLMQGVVQCLNHLAQAAPLILFFDDIHWADTASLELLHYAARHCLAQPILIVAAYSPELAVDNSSLQAFSSKTAPTSIEIRSVTDAEIAQFLEAWDLPVSREIRSQLYQQCDGNRFVLVEMLRMLRDGGKIPLELSGQAGYDALPVPSSVQAIVQTRIDTLNHTERRVLAAMAVVGRPCGLALLQHICGQQEMDLLGHVELLMQRAFLYELTDDASGSVAFSHSFVRRVAYDEMSPFQRQTLHRRTAEALLAQSKSPMEPVADEEIAYHYEQAGHPDSYVHLCRAAEQAAALFALPHATALYARALANESLANDTARRYEILLASEALLDQQGRRAEQKEAIAVLLAQAEAMGNPRCLATALVRQAGYLNAVRQADRSIAVAEEALALYRQEGDSAGEAQALRELGFLDWSASNNGIALEYGRSALQLHRKLGDISGEATALHNLAEIYRALQSPRQALAHYQRALDLQWAEQDHRRQGLTLYGMAHALRQQGDQDGALIRYDQALVQTQAAGDMLMRSRVYHALASLNTEVGDLTCALDNLQQAVTISEGIGYAAGVAHSLFGLSYLYTLLAQPDAAREVLQDALVWFDLMEDQEGAGLVSAKLEQLETDPGHAGQPPENVSWIRTHVTLQEGKVYCEFESPGRRECQTPRRISE